MVKMAKESSSSRGNIKVLICYFFAALIAGVGSLVWLWVIPSDPGNVWLFGASKTRIAMILGVIFGDGLFAMLGLLTWRKPDWQVRISGGIVRTLRVKLFYALLILLSFLGVIGFSQLIWFSKIAVDAYIQGYLSRIAPLFFWGFGLSLINLIFLPVLRHESSGKERKLIDSKILRTSSIILFVLLIFWVVIAVTGIGLIPDQIGWDAPGVPVIAFQIWLALGLGFFYLIAVTFFSRIKFVKNLQFDFLITVLLWGLAVLLWRQMPINPSYFSPTPRAPNYEYYPYSDASIHDNIAQNLLVGEGFPGVARKPLYALFLAGLHILAGQDYDRIANLQVLVIALFPVFAYWIAKSLHHRVSGVIVAMIIILREKTSLGLAGVLGVSHVKLLMSDLPATLGIVILTWMLVTWVGNPQKFRWFPLSIGGVMGLLLLLRPQISVLVPLLFLFVGFLFWRRPRRGLIEVGLIAIGLGFTILPWLWRSYTITGALMLNEPQQTAFLTQLYSLEPGANTLTKNPGESDKAFEDRVKGQVSTFIRQHPDIVARFIGSHFVHSYVEMMVTLPMSPWFVQNPAVEYIPDWLQKFDRVWNICCSPMAYTENMPFWENWVGAISPEMAISTIFNLAILALGLGVAWTRRDILGWIPLGISLAYVLSTAVGRYSGWRLILPADWVLLLYFGIGLGQVALWFFAFITGERSISGTGQKPVSTLERFKSLPVEFPAPLGVGVQLSLILLIFGLSPILVETLVQPRYSEEITSEEIISILEDSQLSGSDVEMLRSAIQNENVLILQGRALYPRYYPANDGEPGGWPAFTARDYDRLVFYLVGPHRADVVLALDNPVPYFPNASDVVLIGCQASGYIAATAVAILDDSHTVILQSPLFHPPCLSLTP